MDLFHEIELFDCPQCHGPGLIQEENGWCLYVECLDCGCHTAELSFKNDEEKVIIGIDVGSTIKEFKEMLDNDINTIK